MAAKEAQTSGHHTSTASLCPEVQRHGWNVGATPLGRQQASHGASALIL